MLARRILTLLLTCLVLAYVGAPPLRPAAADSNAITAGEVMAAVNALRQSQGLQAYTVDAGITAYAQEHSEYQARIDQSTHLHSDGLVSLAHGLVENVAGGSAGYLTAETVVYEIWKDPVHGKTMTGYESGAAGVGVASNSTTTFITLNVRPSGSKIGTPGLRLDTTPIALVPLRTATMKPNGAVIHEVGYGQSLWAIALAYGVSIARIRELNGMAADDNAIWAGQRLLIVPAGLVTPTPPPESGAVSPTGSDSTLVAVRVSPTATPSDSPVQAATIPPTPPVSGSADQLPFDPVLAGLFGLAAVGLILFLSSGVKINRRER